VRREPDERQYVYPQGWHDHRDGDPDGPLVSDPNTSAISAEDRCRVKKGDTVEWDWTDQSFAHTVTAEDGSFDSGLCNVRQKFFVTFSNTGTINYKCTIHAQMIGVVTVS